MKKLFLTALLLVSSSSAWAQQGAGATNVPPLPQGPLLKRAPEFSEWVITYAMSQPVAADKKGDKSGRAPEVQPQPGPDIAQGTPATPKRVIVTSAGPVRHVVTIDSDGRKTEAWCKGNLQVFDKPEWSAPVVTDGLNLDDALRIDFSKTDFPGFEWISPSNYRGVQKVGERDCLIFSDVVVANKDVVARTATEAQDEAKYSAKAYVDLERRLPVWGNLGGEIMTIKFSDTKPGVLALPPRVQTVIDQRSEALKRMTRRPPRPY